jgi:nucleoside-diphosphate-sugar epimerase
MEGIDSILHTAAIIPPMSDQNPELAHEVNVGGTLNLIRAAEAARPTPKFIYTSSVAVYGHPMKLGKPPRTADDPVEPTDYYTRHKIHCEGVLRHSQLNWTIFRLGAVTPLNIDTVGMDPIMFEVPLDQRIEFVHTRDVGIACANAIDAPTTGKTLLIGGGKSCQMLYEDMVSKMMDATGIGMLPASAFKQPQTPDEYFHTDWLDTRESQHLLRFQHRSYDQFIDDYLEELGYRRYAIRAFRPIIRWRLLTKSPYYHSSA